MFYCKDPFASFKKYFDKVERQCLNATELNELDKKEFKIERLKQVRDMFLFSCYTGLSYIDLAELTPDNIIIGIDGGLWLATSLAKTETSARIPLRHRRFKLGNLKMNYGFIIL